MKNNVLFETFKMLENERINAENKREEIDKRIEAKIEEVNREFASEIDEVNANIILATEKVEDFGKQIKKYSTFDACMIGKILAALISLVEFDEYEFKRFEHDGKKYVVGPYGSEETVVNNYWNLISNKSNLILFDGENGEIRDKNSTIALSVSEHGYSDTVCFYELSGQSIYAKVKFDNFPYVNDFMNSLVAFRYQNKIEEMSEKEILAFVSEYVRNNKGLVEEKYRLKEMEQRKKLDEKLNSLIPTPEIVEEEKHREVPSDNLIDRIGYVFENQQKIDNFITPLERKFKDLLENIDYEYAGSKGKVAVLLEDIMYSSPTTLIGKISLNGDIEYYHDFYPYLEGDEIAHVHDKGIIAVYDISGMLPSEFNDINRFKWFLGVPSGIVTLIDNYIVVIKSYSKFSSNEFSLPLEEIDYSDDLEKLKKYGEKIDALCDTPDDGLESLRLRLMKNY